MRITFHLLQDFIFRHIGVLRKGFQMSNVTRREVLAWCQDQTWLTGGYSLEQVFQFDFFDLSNHSRFIAEVTFRCSRNMSQCSFSTRSKSSNQQRTNRSAYPASLPGRSDLARTSDRPLPAFCFWFITLTLLRRVMPALLLELFAIVATLLPAAFSQRAVFRAESARTLSSNSASIAAVRPLAIVDSLL